LPQATAIAARSVLERGEHGATLEHDRNTGPVFACEQQKGLAAEDGIYRLPCGLTPPDVG
jgi:hypothetical protein